MELYDSGWDGQRDFVPVSGNSALLLNARKNRPIAFEQEVDTRKKRSC